MTEDTVSWVGAADLTPMLVPVATLRTHPRNPRRGKVAVVKESFARFGQTQPIIVNADGEIIAGNHAYLAVRELGWTHIAAVATQLEDVGEQTGYLLADNRTAELGTYDEAQRLALLEELEETGVWDGTGYGPDDLEDLRALHDRIAETSQQEFEGDFAVTPEELAARAATLSGGRTLSEVVLLLTGAQDADFKTQTRILEKHYGTSGVTETVARAMKEAAAR